MILRIAAGAFLILLLAGCLRAPQETFYTLLPGSAEEKVGALADTPSVAIAPVTVPEVVDRPQLVLSTSGPEVRILELHRWAEPLRSQIPRILAHDLSLLLGSGQVSYYPQNAGTDAQFKVQVDVVRFEGTAAQGVAVEALWSVTRASDRSRRQGHTLARETVTGAGYDAVMTAYSRALSRVSGDIAQAIRLCNQGVAGGATR